jgi:hypothetical protein
VGGDAHHRRTGATHLTFVPGGVKCAPRGGIACAATKPTESTVNELAFKFIVVMWVGAGALGVLFLFRRGLAAALLRSFSERGSVALGWVVLVALIPLMLALGMIAYLYTTVAEDRNVENRRKTMDEAARQGSRGIGGPAGAR